MPGQTDGFPGSVETSTPLGTHDPREPASAVLLQRPGQRDALVRPARAVWKSRQFSARAGFGSLQWRALIPDAEFSFAYSCSVGPDRLCGSANGPCYHRSFFATPPDSRARRAKILVAGAHQRLSSNRSLGRVLPRQDSGVARQTLSHRARWAAGAALNVIESRGATRRVHKLYGFVEWL